MEIGKSARSEEVSLDKIVKEITTGHVHKWPKKGLLPSRKLSVKYVILNRVGAINWEPTNHRSSVSTTLAKLIYLVGTKATLNFEEYVFN